MLHIVKRPYSLILILLLALMNSRAQIPGIDTLFRANELVYFSDLERKTFGNFLDGNTDYLAMIAAIDPNTDERELGLYRDWLDKIIGDIRKKKFDQLSEESKIERIRKYVSKALLVSYEYKASFDDLFRFGNYNYLTAAAIYAFILDQFGIPYKIYEMSTHIYLVAYPYEQQIAFETSTPGSPFFIFAHQTRTNFVEFMHRQGIIDDMTYRNTSTRDLFEQYFFAGYGLTIREMIGMLYINSAVDLVLEDRTGDSYAQLEKAFILHPSYKSQYLLLVHLNGYLLKMNYHDSLDLGYLIKASRLIDYGVERELVETYLKDIVNTVLVKEEDQEGFENIYEYLQMNLPDEDLKRNFTFHYLYQSGRMEFNNARYARALDYLEPAYDIRPEDERTKDLLARSLGGYSMVVSPGFVLEKIRKYDTACTAIKSEEIYLMVKLQTCLVLFGEAFHLRDGQTGEQYMAEFEKLLDENPETGIDHILIGRSYSSAAIYYYRKGMINKSLHLLKKGLSYAPDNIELKLKLSSFE